MWPSFFFNPEQIKQTMNVSIETITGLERRLTIALPSEDFETRITERLQEARGQVRIPGFRPGKVPLKEVRRRYGQAVRAEVAGEIMQASFVEAVQQEDLQPAGSPNLEVVKMEPGIDFEFTATFEVFPSIDLAPFSKVKVKRPSAEITEEDLESMVQRLREQRTTFEPVERAAQSGDKVKVDFSGTMDGVEVEGTSGEDMEFTIGQGQMIEDFDQGVLGLTVGESKTFDAVFPEDYRAEDLQGKTVTFTVTMKAVTEAREPELDDEFFQAFGVEEGGVEAFRAEVRDNMQRELDGAVKNQIKQQVMDKIAELHEFSVPHAVVHREIHVLKDQMLSQFQMGGQGAKPELPDELFTDQAEKRVRVGLVVNEIISARELTAEAALVDAKLEEMAAPYGEPEQVVAYFRSQPEQMQNIEMGVLEDQVVDLIVSEAEVEEVVSSYDDVISGQAIAPEPEPEPEALVADEAGDVEDAVEAAADADADTENADQAADAQTPER